MGAALDFLAGAVCGALSCWGVGGGTLLILYMTGPGGIAQRAAQGVNLLFFPASCAGGLVSHMKNGYIDRACVLPALISGLVACAACAVFVGRVPADLLRRAFGVLLLIMGAIELVSSVKSLYSAKKCDKLSK